MGHSPVASTYFLPAHPSGLDGVIPNTPTCLDPPVFFPSVPQSFPLVIIACWRGQRLIWPISTLSTGQQLPEDRALVIVPMISQSSSVPGTQWVFVKCGMKERKFAVRFGASQMPTAEGHCLAEPSGPKWPGPTWHLGAGRGLCCPPEFPLHLFSCPVLEEVLLASGDTCWRSAHGTSLGGKGGPRNPETSEVPPSLDGHTQ